MKIFLSIMNNQNLMKPFRQLTKIKTATLCEPGLTYFFRKPRYRGSHFSCDHVTLLRSNGLHRGQTPDKQRRYFIVT
jgi:hypothetical protein